MGAEEIPPEESDFLMYSRLLLAALAAFPLHAWATSPREDANPLSNTALPPPDSINHSGPWYRPHHVLAQTGGGLGMVAVGGGYAFWKNRTEADVLVGYVPKKYAGSTLTLISVKLLYSPWQVPLGQKWTIKPLTVGAYYSHSYGVINAGERGQYTKGYYWFSRKDRVGPILGSRLSYVLPPTATGRPRSISGYYELGSNDLYLISYVQNTKALSPADILTLSLGVKLEF